MPRVVLYQAGGEVAEIVSPALGKHRFLKGQVVAFTANVTGTRGGRPGVRQAQLLATDDVTQLVLLGFGPSKSNGQALDGPAGALRDGVPSGLHTGTDGE